jgi:hypothetical protein
MNSNADRSSAVRSRKSIEESVETVEEVVGVAVAFVVAVVL